MLSSFLYGEFLLHLLCWLFFYFYFLCWGVSLTHPMLVTFSSPLFFFFFFSFFFFFFFHLGSFSYTSRAGFIFIWGVSLKHPTPPLVSGEFLLHIPCRLHFYMGSFSYTSCADFFLCGEFLFHIPCSLLLFFIFTFFSSFFLLLFFFCLSFFIWGVSLTHPVLASYLSGVFLLHIPRRL